MLRLTTLRYHNNLAVVGTSANEEERRQNCTSPIPIDNHPRSKLSLSYVSSLTFLVVATGSKPGILSFRFANGGKMTTVSSYPPPIKPSQSKHSLIKG